MGLNPKQTSSVIIANIIAQRGDFVTRSPLFFKLPYHKALSLLFNARFVCSYARGSWWYHNELRKQPFQKPVLFKCIQKITIELNIKCPYSLVYVFSLETIECIFLDKSDCAGCTSEAAPSLSLREVLKAPNRGRLCSKTLGHLKGFLSL